LAFRYNASVTPKSNFQTAFAELNPAQKQAAEQIEGPLLILAGPGTGKTQTVALRLANILAKTQAKPHNLLALTYTESGAIALKKRLASIIGAEAYGITATTFHSFCQSLAGMFPSEFAGTKDRTPLDELGKFKLLRDVLGTGNYPELAPAKNADGAIGDIGSALSTLKREGVTPTKLLELIGADETELAGLERVNKRTGKPFGKVLDLEKKITKNKELARIYAAYQALLAERELADFDDLILDVVAKLQDSNNEFLLAYLQENYLYVTVDEFQDTNGAQEAILRAWASYDDSPNLCVVGDDDQSIYRFQGASLANILDFRANYPKAEIVTLTANYRSTQPILDASRSLIEKNEQRLTNAIPDLSKILTAAGKQKSGAEPKILNCQTAEDEAACVAREIQKLLAAGTQPAEIAVLYRKRRHADLLADYLQRAAVPAHRLDGQNALTNKRVQQLVGLLQAVERPNDPAALLSVLFADYSGIQPVDAYRLARAVERDDAFLDFLTDEAKLAELGAATERRPAIVFRNPESLQKLTANFLNWLELKQTVSLTELTESIAAESGLSATIVSGKEYESAEAVAAFVDFVRSFEISSESAGLAELLADLKTMQSQNLSLKLSARAHAAVQLMTAHGAKGLEFQHVFVIHATDNDWGGRRRGERIKLPDLVEGAPGADPKATYLEDERRLFYVALTRARQSLTLTVAASYEGREQTPSRFLAELSAELINREQVKLAPAEKLPFLVPTDLRPELDPESRAFLTSLVEYLRISPSALNTYLACPRRFLFEQLLRVPASLDPSDRAGAIFGTAVHAALEEFYRELRQTGKLPATEIALAALEKSLRREPLTAKQRADFRRDAGAAVEKYLEFYSPTAVPPIDVEFSFARHEVHLDAIPLTGKIDRIDPIAGQPKAVRCLDYKTSPVATRNAILGLTANSTGDAYRQLVFYKLLAELDSRFVFEVAEVVLAFVGPTEKGEFVEESFTPTAEELAALKTQIREIHARIQKLEFSCTEDTEACRNCRLKKLCGR
jgi:DNA helicase-2/ATP-dependent DNA helicase PcrA